MTGDRRAVDAAVLLSGGLDSAILVGDWLAAGTRVRPLFIRGGLAWESAELAHVRRFLKAIQCPKLEPLTVLQAPMDDLLAEHWSVTSVDVPDARSRDEAVFLPGRNVILLGKAMIWCHLNQVGSLAIATLRGNPFPDATARFVRGFQRAVNEAIGGSVEIQQPYARYSKAQVMERGRTLPLELTFSCIQPVRGRHCGSCNKCAERRQAFQAIGAHDRTRYFQPAEKGHRPPA